MVPDLHLSAPNPMEQVAMMEEAVFSHLFFPLVHFTRPYLSSPTPSSRPVILYFLHGSLARLPGMRRGAKVVVSVITMEIYLVSWRVL